MSELNSIIAVLGEENAEKLKENIVQLIINQVEDDLHNYSEYLLYPPDMRTLINEAMESTEKKVAKMYKDAIIEINQDYINKMKEYMSKQIVDPEKIMRKEILDLAHQLTYYNDLYGRNERLSKKLLEIADIGQEEMGEKNEDTNID